MQIKPALTAQPPHSRSREEATAAFEAAVISKLGLKTPERSRKHLDQFGKILTGPAYWFLVAKRASPNRGTVTVETLKGEVKEISIVFKKVYSLVRWTTYSGYLISEKFLELRQAQLKAYETSKEYVDVWEIPLNNETMFQTFSFTEEEKSSRELVTARVCTYPYVKDDFLTLRAVRAFLGEEEFRMRLLAHVAKEQSQS